MKVFRKYPVRITFVLTLVIILLAAGVCYWTYNTAKPKKNLIIISIDTLRQDHIGAYGYERETTPNIDKFAKNAAIFTNVYTQVPETYPSFAAFMTGVSPFESNIYRNGQTGSPGNSHPYLGSAATDPATPTLAKVLQANNYLSAAFIANTALDPSLTGLDKGFSKYWMIPFKPNQKTSESVTNKGIEWLQEHRSTNKPLFLWIHYLDPHSPYTPSSQFACKLNSRFCESKASEDIKNLKNEEDQFRGCQKDSNMNKDVIDLHMSLYDAEIRETDMYVGRVLDEIKKEGLDKNSIIVIYGDHGESFDHDYYFFHQQMLNESSIKIPLVIYGLGKNNNTKYGFLMKNSDLYPTILSLLGINPPDKKTYNFDFSSYLKEETSKIDAREAPMFYLNAPATKFAVRDGSYKYILSLDSDRCIPRSKTELYDLQNDPNELHNLINDTSKKSFADKLHYLLIEYLSNNQLEIGPKDAELESKEQTVPGKKRQEIIEQLKSLGY